MTDGSKPCCRVCSCSDHCSHFGNCCHDKQNFSIDITTHSSLPTFKCINSRRMPAALADRVSGNTAYMVIRTCPEDAEGVSTCFSESSLKIKDFIFVSGKSQFGTVIFINRRCAMCNNATDIKEWDFKTLKCPEVGKTMNTTITKIIESVINNCIIESIPHSSDKVHSEMYRCFDNSLIIRNCNGNNSETVSQEFKQKCEELSPSSRHDYFIFIDATYANYYCFKCNNPETRPLSQCSTPNIGDRSFLDASFTALLDISYAYQLTEMEENCMSNQLHDPYLVRAFDL